MCILDPTLDFDFLFQSKTVAIHSFNIILQMNIQLSSCPNLTLLLCYFINPGIYFFIFFLGLVCAMNIKLSRILLLQLTCASAVEGSSTNTIKTILPLQNGHRSGRVWPFDPIKKIEARFFSFFFFHKSKTRSSV